MGSLASPRQTPPGSVVISLPEDRGGQTAVYLKPPMTSEEI